jgi:glycerate kinase
VLAAPDSFKGTAGASDIAAAVVASARAAGWQSDPCPLSDGGEGFAEVVAARHAGGGAWRTSRVAGPLGAPVVARWWLGPGEAVVESAAASGLPLAGGPEGNDPVGATTRGTGELIAAAVAAGASRVLVGVGGSATTDGGRGALEAIEEHGGLGGAEVVVACDVQTRFVDAAEVFGPQKGATPAQVAELRRRLEDLVVELRRRYGVDVSTLPGAGAAGGLAGGLAAVGARLVPGFDVVSESVGLVGRLGAAQLVVTGEGRLDESSWSGKVVGGVVGLARPAGVPVLVVAGEVAPGQGKRRVGAVEVRSLTERCGRDRARADPSGCVERVVREFLTGRLS